MCKHDIITAAVFLLADGKATWLLLPSPIFLLSAGNIVQSMNFAKCKGILNFCEALSQRNNKNVKLSILFHLVTIISKQDSVLQKHLIS